jgi:hypothetical protein
VLRDLRPIGPAFKSKIASHRSFSGRQSMTVSGDELPDTQIWTLSAIARIAAVRQFGSLTHFQRKFCPSGAIADDLGPHI